jgi:hypothetical protein
LARIGLINNIYEAAVGIDAGRKGFATKGKAEEGRILYEEGIALALAAFQEAQTTADPQTIILAEYTFITQELQLCSKTDRDTQNSLTQAIQNFDDAFLILKIVEEKTLYHVADKAIPNYEKYRIKGFPKDSFHIACGSHKTRIKNILRAPGIDLIEKELLQQRLANLSSAQSGYVEKQNKALVG